MHWLLAALLLANSPDVTRSVRLTTAAEQLLDFEKKMATSAPERIDDLLFGDVLALLDLAVNANPSNLHARALRSQVLLVRSFDGESRYDICYILDAHADAEFIVTHASHAPAADVKIARDVLHGIELIPPSAIPDPPSVCDEDDEEHGTRTKIR